MSQTSRLRMAGSRILGATVHPAPDQQTPDWVRAIILLAVLTVPIMIGALLQAAGLPLFWPIYVVSVAAMVWFFWQLRDQPAMLVTAFLFWAAIHKLVVAGLAGPASAQSITWLQNYKELMYPTIFAVGLGAAAVRTRQANAWRGAMLGLTWPDLLALGFLALIGVYFLVSFLVDPGALTSQLIYARRFASLPIIFLAGRLLPPSLEQLQTALRYLVGLAVVVAIFGIVERLLLGDWFWTGLLDVSRLRTSLVDQGFVSSRSHMINDMPSNWFTYVNGVPVRRLVSTFLEPTTLAFFLAFAIALGLFAMPTWKARHRTGWAIAMAILTVALILTLGKGGYLALGIIVVVVLLRATHSNAPMIALVAVGLAAAGLLIGQFLPIANNLDRHVGGLLTGIFTLSTNLLGSGLGSTGFWGTQSAIGGDSTLGAVVSQLGILGAALFLGWLATAAWALLPVTSGTPRRLQRTVAGGFLALLVVGVFSNSVTGLLAGAAYAIFAGWTLSVTASPRAGAEAA